jgi:hypothetical protein
MIQGLEEVILESTLPQNGLQRNQIETVMVFSGSAG